MGDINSDAIKNFHDNQNNALNSLKKNLREELSSMAMIVQDSDGEY